jgi:kynureninase
MPLTLKDLEALDAADPLRGFRDRFALPDGVVYLDGNSLGALPRQTLDRLHSAAAEAWGDGLIRSWTRAGWIDAPARVGAKIAPLIGASAHEVVAADSTSVNLFKLVVAALSARPGRKVVLSEPGNFPTDLYMIQGALQCAGPGARLELRPRGEIAEAIGPDTALVVLTHVHYKTAEVFDMAAITRRAHDNGALALWDLSHSAGAVAVDLNGAGADLAVGCGYKYLNGGPGAPSFLFVAERHHQALVSPLSGWMGHARPFDFVDDYAPAPGVARFLCGTPPVLGLAGLEAGVEIMLEAGMAVVAEKSARMCEALIALVDQECAGHGLVLVGPPPGASRGSHVSFAHPEGYAVMQALIDRGVIGDFRAPDIVRFGVTPLNLGYADLWRAVSMLRAVLEQRLWDAPAYKTRGAVT